MAVTFDEKFNFSNGYRLQSALFEEGFDWYDDEQLDVSTGKPYNKHELESAIFFKHFYGFTVNWWESPDKSHNGSKTSDYKFDFHIEWDRLETEPQPTFGELLTTLREEFAREITIHESTFIKAVCNVETNLSTYTRSK